jgi:hypothetical protein
MSCIRCENLECELEGKQSEYNGALESPYYRVSTKFVAYLRVELERTRNELGEHRSVCASAFRQPTLLQTVALPRIAR